MAESPKTIISKGYLQLMPRPVLRTQSLYSSVNHYQKQLNYLEQYPDISLQDGCEIYVPRGKKGSPQAKLCLETIIRAFQDNFRPDPDLFAYNALLESRQPLPSALLTLCREQMDAIAVCRISDADDIRETLSQEALRQGSVGGSVGGSIGGIQTIIP